MYKTIISYFFISFFSSNLFANTDESILFKAGWQKVGSAYFDTNSSLVWDKTVRKGTWEQAKSFCQKYKLDNKSNWSLPTIVQLQSAVCLETGYKTRNACNKPRDHNTDLWLLYDPSFKFWTIDIVPGDPFNAYYFEPISEGQHIISTKNDVHSFVCVRTLQDETPTQLIYIKEKEYEKFKKEQELKNYNYYFSLLLSIGAYTSNDTSEFNDTLFFGAIDFRVGYNTKIEENKLYFVFSGDLGLDLGHFELPLLSNLTIGPEYFFSDYISLYGAAGLGITRKQYLASNGYLAENNIGLAWKFSSSLNFIQWGEYKHQKNIPLVLTYTGTRTSASDISHVFLIGLGFKLFD